MGNATTTDVSMPAITNPYHLSREQCVIATQTTDVSMPAITNPYHLSREQCVIATQILFRLSEELHCASMNPIVDTAHVASVKELTEFASSFH